MDLRISKLDHLVLVTSDLSRCVSFYRDLLHMEVEEKDGRFALRFGTSKNQYPYLSRRIPAGGGKACAGESGYLFRDGGTIGEASG